MEPHPDSDILIVGAGVAGAATAFHLRRRGIGPVRILEREALPGVHSSGRSAAIVREHADHATEQRLLSAGADALRRGELAEFEPRGVMLLGLGEDDAAARFPGARGLGRWAPRDGTVDVAGLLATYLDGQDVRYETRLLAWEAHDAYVSVSTSAGDMRCRILVNAAGSWAGELFDLPLTPTNRHLFFTPPLDWVDPRWPCVWSGQDGLYFRPESGGLMLCACDESRAAPGDYREDPRVLETLAEKLSRLQPGLGELSIRASWVGQRTFAPDRGFVIGFDPRWPRVFHVAGLGGHGVTASYAVGGLAAARIAGERPAGAEVFDPARLLDEGSLGASRRAHGS